MLSPQTKIKRRKQSIWDDREEAPKVILCRWPGVYFCAGAQNALSVLEIGKQGCEHFASKECRLYRSTDLG